MSGLANALRKTAAGGKPAAGGSLPPEQIRARLAELDAEEAALLRESGPLAERSIDDPAAQAAYDANVARAVEVDRERRRLKDALASMEARAAEAATAEVVAEQGRLRKRVVDQLERTAHQAKDIEAKIADLVAAVREFGAGRHAAYMGWPGRQPEASGLALGQAEIERLLAAEIFRANDVPLLTGGASADRPIVLPGGKSPGFDFSGEPSKIPSLSTAISASNAAARRELEGVR